MLLNIQFLTGQKGIVSGLQETDTVGDLKLRVADLDFAPAPADQKLLFGGKLLTDDTVTLADLDIFGETCIMCVSKPRLPSAAPPPVVEDDDDEEQEEDAAGPMPGGGGAAAAPVAEPEAVPVVAVVEPVPDGAAAGVPVVRPVVVNEAAVPSGGGGGGGGGGAAAAAVEAKEEAEGEEMIALSLKTLRGTSTLIEVPAHATFGHIKHKYIQPLEDIPAIQMRLIYMGQLTDDSKTPFDYNICRESFIHLVRRPNESIKNEVITKLKLRANCRWCHQAGVQLVLRPACRVCGNEGAMYKDRVIEVGKSKWVDLENLKGVCYSCSPGGREVALDMGFLCTGQPGSKGPTCPSRAPQLRRMIHSYTGGDLVESLNQIFGYAHARGFEV